MKSITVKFGGKVWENVECNNSGWIAPGAPADLVQALKNAPRSGVTSKGIPIVKSDDGTNLYLGAAELRNEGESVHAAGGSGNTVKDTDWWPHLEGLLKAKGIPDDTKKFLESKLNEKTAFEKAQAEKAAKEQADTIAKVMKMTGKTEEQVRKMLGL